MKPTVQLRLVVAAFALVALAGVVPAAAQSYPHFRAAASPFVPLDSWVYPAIERLASLGYVDTAMTGLKPWTRIECARLTDEAGEALRQEILEDRVVSDTAAKLHGSLEREFAFELEVLGGGPTRAARLESVYARVMSISGAPLTDGFHFGQTVSYDFGRPARQGTNTIVGSSGWVTAGPLAIYARGEFQQAPSASALSNQVLDFIASADSIPRSAAQRFDPIQRGRLLDTYVTLNIKNWQFSAGKQSLSWSTGAGGSLLLSDNAEPMYMVRATRVLPVRWPWILRKLGPVRSEFFVTQLQGHKIVPQPYMYGHKITIKPWRNLEIGFGRTTMLGGGNYPVTLSVFLKSYFGFGQSRVNGSVPGDSRNSFDWNWRVPGTRDYLVFYGEIYADDDPIGWQNPAKSAFRPGIHLTRIPGLPKLDFWAEAASTESPYINFKGTLNYYNGQYPDGYRNNGNLLGNTVGREGRSILLLSNYWFSPQHVLQFSMRHNLVKNDFVPGGGSWQDFSVRHEIALRSGAYVKSLIQFEHIARYPILFPGSRNNVTVSLEVGFKPEPPK